MPAPPRVLIKGCLSFSGCWLLCSSGRWEHRGSEFISQLEPLLRGRRKEEQEVTLGICNAHMREGTGGSPMAQAQRLGVLHLA